MSAPKPRPDPPTVGGLPESIAGWIADGALDAPLAAVVWLLAEGGVPVVVAASDALAARGLADALDAFGRPSALLATFPRSLVAASLEEVQARLAEPPYQMSEDAIRSVGVVLVLHKAPEGGWRVGAAHYVRPLEQDPHGHVQRRPPALLAAWDADADRFDDYAWGITAELAGRVGCAPSVFEAARHERAGRLQGLVADGVTERVAVARALATGPG